MTPLETTFVGWAAEGRSVRRGEQARFYLVDPNDPGARGVALFALDQTEERSDLQTGGMERVSAEEYHCRRAEARRPKAKAPLAKLTWHPESKTLKVWVGTHKDAIAGLRAGKWVFDLPSHRWRKSNVDPVAVAQKLTGLGMRVEAEGFHYAPDEEGI